MDFANALIGRAEKPTAEEVSAALGPSAKVWQQLVKWLVEDQGVAAQEWKSMSLKYGWSLRLKREKRTIVYLSPCIECFLVSFVLGDKAIKAARHSNLPQSVVKAIDDAPRYTEGTGLRLLVKGTKDLSAIRKLVVAKLAN